MSDTGVVDAPAKVNLFLRVLHRRADGYHELETLFQAIDLADEVRVEVGGGRVELEVEGADLGPPEENLAFLAASGFCSEAGLEVGVKIYLTKRIPVGAGLGGGSSDAAAVLKCLRCLLGGFDGERRLDTLGVALGSDVPFFLGGSALAWGTGRGELLEPLRPLPEADLVSISPPVQVSTAAAYSALASARIGEAPDPEPPTAGRPTSWRDVEAVARNDFQPVIARAYPEVARSLEALEDAGASVALLSGSGSTSFGLFADRAAAESAADSLTAELGWPCRAIRTLAALPVPGLR